MPTPSKGPRLGGGAAHERHILANLATSLFEHGRITTTQKRAKRLQPFAERLLSKAKRGDLHARRQVSAVIRNKTPRRWGAEGDAYTIVHRLFEEIAPKLAEREGGYTRITKLGPRKGDNAPLALIELVLEPVSPKQAVVREAEGATKRSTKESVTTDESTEDTAQPSADDAVTDSSAAEAPAEDGAEEVAEKATDAES